MHQMVETAKTWLTVLADAWRTRRTDDGGVTDETAMMGLMALAAVGVGGLIYALVTGAVGRIDLGF